VKFAVFDASYANGGLGAAGKLLKTWLHFNGLLADVLSADVLLVTTVSSAPTKIKFDGPVIVGGPGALNPSAWSKGSTAVVLGDFVNWCKVASSDGLAAALELLNVYIDGQDRAVEIDQSFPWGLPACPAEDGRYQFVLSRGCKKRCAFCKTGWALRYAEHPSPGRIRLAAERAIADKKKINYVTNDATAVPWASALPPIPAASMSLGSLRRARWIKPPRQVRLGVEGVSERIRKAVQKPAGMDDLIAATRWLNAKGSSVRWFMMCGFPGEDRTDWDELRCAVRDYARSTTSGHLALSFTAFKPQPGTPLARSPLADDYWDNWLAFKEWYFSSGWSNRISLFSPAGPKTRAKHTASDLDCKPGDVSPNERVIHEKEKHRAAALKAYNATMGTELQ